VTVKNVALPKAPNPTISQTRFAAGLAAGQSKVDAYVAAHPKQQGKRKTVKTNAAAAAKQQAVQFELARLLTDPAILEHCPGSVEPHLLMEHGVAILVRLSKGSAGPELAFKSAIWLVEHAVREREREREMKRLARKDSKAEIIADLRGLYAAALAAPAEELVSEVIESDSEVIETSPETSPATG
jgi:hypothetical protein